MNLLAGSPQQGAGRFWSRCSSTFRSRLCHPLGKPPCPAAEGRGADLSALLPDPPTPHVLPSSSSHGLSCPHHPSFLRQIFGPVFPIALHCAHLLDCSLPPPGLCPHPRCCPPSFPLGCPGGTWAQGWVGRRWPRR